MRTLIDAVAVAVLVCGLFLEVYYGDDRPL
jgi:hypothetical protein